MKPTKCTNCYLGKVTKSQGTYFAKARFQHNYS